MESIEILIVGIISVVTGIIMVFSHAYLKVFTDNLHVVASYVYGSTVNFAAILLAFSLVGKFDLIRLAFYFAAIWGCTGGLVSLAYTMDFAGKLVRRKKVLKDGKGTGK